MKTLLALAAVVGTALLPMSARAMSCRDAPAWQAESPSGELTLSHADGTLELRHREADRRIWRVSGLRFTWDGIVSDAGRVATRSGCGSAGYDLRGSDGAVEASVAELEMLSLWERFEGYELRLRRIDDAEGVLVAERFRDRDGVSEAMSRRVRLTDGRVLDSPVSPAGFLPDLPCAAPRRLRWGIAMGIVAACTDDAAENGSLWVFDFEGGFKLLAFVQLRAGRSHGRDWEARDGEDGACERTYDDGKLVAENCGPDVRPPPEAGPVTSSSRPSSSAQPSSSRPSSAPPSSPPPSSSPASSR